MSDEPELCIGCEHLLANERNDMQLPENAFEHFCAHDDLFEVGINEPDAGEFSNFIGFMPVIPDWCPLKFWQEQNNFYKEKRKQPPMQYMILKWIPDDLKWDVVFYCQDYKQYEVQAVKYPETNGYVHMVDVKWLPGHQVYADIAEMKKRIYAEALAKAKAAKQGG